MHRAFTTPSQALCWLVECTYVTAESLELRTRPPVNELARQLRMAADGVENLRRFGFAAADAEGMRCPRVARAIVQSEDRERAKARQAR